MMKENGKRVLWIGVLFLAVFIIWTVLIKVIDVQPVGANGTDIGFAAMNGWFHELTGVHMEIYIVTDWLGLIPIVICMVFGGIGCVQMIKRRSLFKVDYDMILLGIYYLVVIFGYLFFEMIPINYRPILMDGFLEASYPSSTTLLVICVMSTLVEQTNRRVENAGAKRIIKIFAIGFSAVMVVGRLISGVHWLTDIVGSMLLAAGLFCVYKAAVLLFHRRKS